MSVVAAKKKSINQLPPMPRVPWAVPDEETEPDAPERGEEAVQHEKGARGRRSKLFPDLNITATAARLGVTKSHLAKVLAGKNKPSLDLALKLADVLGKDLSFVAALCQHKSVGQISSAKKPKRKAK